jgi:putative membrane protein
MVVVAAALGTMWQVLPEGSEPDDVIRWLYRTVVDEATTLPAWLTGAAGIGAATVTAIVIALAAVRLLSVALALFLFAGFRLDEIGRQLRVERGLLTRIRLHVPKGRIQAWRLTESILHRWFDRRSLRVDTAGGTDSGSTRGMRDLAPIAEPAVMESLIGHLLPRAAWPPAEWRSLHPHAWRRLVMAPAMLIMALTVVLVVVVGSLGALALLLLPVVVARARLWARHAAYAEVPGSLIAVREGWLTKSWRFAEIRKLQSLRISQSPFDRRHEMATLWLDTAGASARDGQFRIRFLPAAEARALHDRLARGMEP